MRTKTIRWLILAVAICMAGVVAIRSGYLRINYPSFERFPIRGIDISHHQGEIDWGALSSEGFTFVFAKATEGVDFIDTDYQANRLGAMGSGHLVAPYHFYLICRPGLEQAEHFIRTALLDSISLPPVIDLEFVGYCKDVPARDTVVQEIKACIDRVTEHCGRPPLLYVTNDFYATYIAGNFADCPIWIRDIIGKPELPDGRKWTFWQFANRGHASGITGPVDLNVFHGDEATFRSFLYGEPDHP